MESMNKYQDYTGAVKVIGENSAKIINILNTINRSTIQYKPEMGIVFNDYRKEYVKAQLKEIEKFSKAVTACAELAQKCLK